MKDLKDSERLEVVVIFDLFKEQEAENDRESN